VHVFYLEKSIGFIYHLWTDKGLDMRCILCIFILLLMVILIGPYILKDHFKIHFLYISIGQIDKCQISSVSRKD